ncbi:MAG: DNA-3-methyladenine glycosylase [Deltaproteobacteria bacterium]|nr:DNA-3-methyladenine glycosylase [Deltaproteobacteria bacterium]
MSETSETKQQQTNKPLSEEPDQNIHSKVLTCAFFDRDTLEVARDLIGKVVCHKSDGIWFFARIIETEAYYLSEKGSHASLGETPRRRALFMNPGTIYMYYARGGDSLNVSCKGAGNAVLIKSGIIPSQTPDKIVRMMQERNPVRGSGKIRPADRLCSGQTLLCRSLGIRVPDWDQQQFDPDRFFFRNDGYLPVSLIQTRRLGIPQGRDEQLPYRFIDSAFVGFCTKKPNSFS